MKTSYSRIILASGSPRRRQLMTEIGFDCMVITAGVDETPRSGESPAELAARLAAAKAQAVADAMGSDNILTVILAADTVVAIGDEILGKPEDSLDATRMLHLLRGQRHQVYTAICVMDAQSQEHRMRVNTTQVDMRPYDDAEVMRYVESGDPMDKAGAYAIQHTEFSPVIALEGCISSVMGLPLADVCDVLGEFGVETECAVADICERQADFVCCHRAQRV